MKYIVVIILINIIYKINMSNDESKWKGKEVENDKLDEEGIPFAKEDLPFGGDRLKAMRAQDRKAITLIMKWGNKYGKVEVIKVKDKNELPEIARECGNEEDYVSSEEWSDDNKPDIFIKYMKTDSTFEGTYCYKSNDLNTMINSSQNNFAAWVRPKISATFDDNGFIVLPGEEPDTYNTYAESSIIELFVELPVRRLFMKKMLVEAMEDISEGSNKFVAIPAYQTRAGNVNASYGSGDMHGQAPDKNIYFIVKQQFYDEQIANGGSIFDNIYQLLYYIKNNTTDHTAQTGLKLEDVRNLQNLSPTAHADISYYWWNETKETSLPPGYDEDLIELDDGEDITVLDNDEPGYDQLNGYNDLEEDNTGYEPSSLTDIIELEENRYILNPSQLIALDGKILYLIYYIYNKGNIIQYESEELGDPEGLYIYPYLKNASIVTAGDANPNMNNILNVFEALEHANAILTTYKIASNMIPHLQNIVGGTLKSSIDDNLEESGLQQTSISIPGNWLYLIGNMFLADIIIWLLLDNDGSILDLIFGTSYTYMYLTQSENYIRISKWSDIPSNVDLQTIVDKIINTDTIREDVLKTSYYIHLTFDDNIDNMFGNLLMSLYYTSKLEIGLHVDDTLEKDTAFVKLDALVDGPPEYIAHTGDVFSRTEQSNIDMLANSGELLNTIFKIQDDVNANGYITNSSGIKAKIEEQLQAGKTLVLRHPAPWEYTYDKNLDMEDESIAKVTYKQGDVIDIPDTELIILFTTNEDFRDFLEVGNPQNLENVLEDFIQDINNPPPIIENVVSEWSFIESQRSAWITDPDDETETQANVLSVILNLYADNKFIQYESEVTLMNGHVPEVYLMNASFVDAADIIPDKPTYVDVRDAIEHSDKIIKTYRIGKNLDIGTQGIDVGGTLVHIIYGISLITQNDLILGKMVNIIKWLFAHNVKLWVLDSNGIHVSFGSSYKVIPDNESWICVSNWNQIPISISIIDLLESIFDNGQLIDNMLILSYYSMEDFFLDLDQFMEKIIMGLYYLHESNFDIIVNETSNKIVGYANHETYTGLLKLIIGPVGLMKMDDIDKIIILGKNTNHTKIILDILSAVSQAGFITKVSEIKAKVEEKLQSGETLTLGESEGFVPSVTFQPGDSFNIPDYKIVILFTTSDTFRQFIGEQDMENIENILLPIIEDHIWTSENDDYNDNEEDDYNEDDNEGNHSIYDDYGNGEDIDESIEILDPNYY